MSNAVEKTEEVMGADGKSREKVIRKGISKEAAAKAKREDGELGFGKMLRCRVRYFTDGAVIGSRAFVNEAFTAARERFSEKRKDGARTMRGAGSGAKGVLWSVRDLRVRVE
jgi:hypothetical protein